MYCPMCGEFLEHLLPKDTRKSGDVTQAPHIWSKASVSELAHECPKWYSHRTSLVFVTKNKEEKQEKGRVVDADSDGVVGRMTGSGLSFFDFDEKGIGKWTK